MKETSHTTLPMSAAMALRVFIPFALGYFLSYLYRVVNAVIAPDLIADMGLDASALGLLTAAYFLTFAAAQLPLGILLDHYGPRRIEAGLLVFGALGAAVFAFAPNTETLIIGRALIGFGVSACLMAAFKSYVMWFPKERLALINGFQMMAGGLGALAATQPVEAMMDFTDWRGVFWILAALTLLSAVMIYYMVPEHGGGRHPDAKLSDALGGVKTIFTSAQFWRVAPWCVFSQATFLSVQGLWAGPWLRDVASLSRAEVAEHLLWVATAMVAGNFVWGVIADRAQKHFGLRPMVVSSFGMACFLVVQAMIITQLTATQPEQIIITWMAFSFFATAGILPYAALSQMFPAALAGRVNTSINLLVFVIAFIAQWAIGAIIDLWPHTSTGGYATQGYQAAFATMLGLQICGLVWYVIRHKVRL